MIDADALFGLILEVSVQGDAYDESIDNGDVCYFWCHWNLTNRNTMKRKSPRAHDLEISRPGA